MSHVLLPATPLLGHVGPVVAVGRGLAAAGHRVTVLTGVDLAGLVTEAGLAFRPLPADADLTRLPTVPRRARRLRVQVGRDAIIDTFCRPLAAQHRALTEAIEQLRVDAVLADTAYLGVLPLALGTPRDRRVPVLGLSATPLSLVSADCAPFGSCLAPGTTDWHRQRNERITRWLRIGPLRPLHARMDDELAPYGIPEGTLDYFDHAAAFDVTFQLGGPGTEYPRRDLPSSVRFVGPTPPRPRTSPVPTWWPELGAGRPVVHVTQGTMANGDPRRLIVPTVRALAGRDDLLVVVSTGGLDVAVITDAYGGPLPSHVRAARFLPYAELLPATSVMVTNGGYGGVQQALAHGVPLVVAGDTEEKPETAARVAWSEAGIDLRTGTPSPRRLAAAVQRVLTRPSYGWRAAALGRELAALGDPVATVVAELERQLEQRDPQAGQRALGPWPSRNGAISQAATPIGGR